MTSIESNAGVRPQVAVRETADVENTDVVGVPGVLPRKESHIAVTIYSTVPEKGYAPVYQAVRRQRSGEI
jgi:uncharacterized protein (UPF0297 family)